MFVKDQKVSKKEYTKAAIWCNANGHYIEEVQNIKFEITGGVNHE